MNLTDNRAYIQSEFNGITFMPNNMDVQHEPLYDTLTYAAGAQIPNEAAFFSNQASKTLSQTNVFENRKLPAPEAFAVKGILFRTVEDILLADLISIMNPQTGYALDFRIGEKSYNRGPLWFYACGGGVAGFSSQTDTSFYTNGLPGKIDRHELAINIVIDNQASFFALLRSASTPYTLTAEADGGEGATLQLTLDGLHARGVQ